MTTAPIVSREAPLSSRQLKARQVVLAAGTLDAFAAKWKKYGTTTSSCGCMDWQVRGRRNEIEACYHMEALRLLQAREAGVSMETIEPDRPVDPPAAMAQLSNTGKAQDPRLGLLRSQVGNAAELEGDA